MYKMIEYNNNNFQILNNAVVFRDLNRIKYLIEVQKINVNVRCNYNKNVLYDLIKLECLIVAFGSEQQFTNILLKENTLTILTYLVSQGIDINSQAKDGMNILLWSCILGNIEIIKFLLTHNASMDVYNISYDYNNIQDAHYSLIGYSPIHFAIMKGHYSIVKYFLEQGTEVDRISIGAFAQTPLHVAILHSHYNIVKLLLRYGADPGKNIGSNCHSLFLTIHAINILSRKCPYKYDFQIISTLLELDGSYDKDLCSDSQAHSLLLTNIDCHIEAAKFLLNKYDNNISIFSLKLIFYYAINYQVYILVIKILNIIKQMPEQHDVYLDLKKITQTSKISNMFDGSVVACKYGLKGSLNKKIPLEIVHDIIGFCYGNYISAQKLTSIKAYLATENSLDLNNMDNKAYGYINKRIAKIYSY